MTQAIINPIVTTNHQFAYTRLAGVAATSMVVGETHRLIFSAQPLRSEHGRGGWGRMCR